MLITGLEVGSLRHAASRLDLISMTLTGAGGPAQHAASWFELISRFSWLVAALGVIATLVVAGLVTSSLKRRSQFEVSGDDRREPPWLAESLLCIFARAEDINALMGDFEELFAQDRASGMSQRRAVVRYWARVLRSLWPQIYQWAKRIGWAGLVAVVLRKSGS